ncbi:hypothetical protein D3C73_1371740 [compost metagenome]
MPEKQRADRPGDISDAESGQRQQYAGGGRGGRKENLAEDQCRRRAVDKEIVVLHCAADPARNRGLARCFLMFCCLGVHATSDTALRPPKGCGNNPAPWMPYCFCC